MRSEGRIPYSYAGSAWDGVHLPCSTLQCCEMRIFEVQCSSAANSVCFWEPSPTATIARVAWVCQNGLKLIIFINTPTGAENVVVSEANKPNQVRQPGPGCSSSL